jgi:uncharacterized circularly permuted ATP-grasp superfamily protein
VALPEGELKVNSSQGGGSKDTWVLARGQTEEPAEAAQRLAMAMPAAASAPEMVTVTSRQSGPDQ